MIDWLKEELDVAVDELKYRGDELSRVGSLRPFRKQEFINTYQNMCYASREHKRLERQYNERNRKTDRCTPI